MPIWGLRKQNLILEYPLFSIRCKRKQIHEAGYGTGEKVKACKY